MDVLDHLPVGVVIRDNDGICLQTNATFEEWIGRGDAVGRPVWEWFPPDAAEAVKASIALMISGDTTPRVTRIVDADGRGIRVLLMPRPITLDDGRPGAVLVFVRSSDLEAPHYVGGGEGDFRWHLSSVISQLQVLAVSAPGGRPVPWTTEQIGQLSKRERTILSEMQIGRSSAGIGEELDISASTVRGHVKAICAKLGIQDGVTLKRILARK